MQHYEQRAMTGHDIELFSVLTVNAFTHIGPALAAGDHNLPANRGAAVSTAVALGSGDRPAEALVVGAIARGVSLNR
ncbi:MAG: hypothetical protein JHC57_19820 [Sphingopyxis sp.]|uniref:hypothetical protein n=1 Tax=Sphingopyxis sp. TaxID=1908224 RepID=UPI001A216BB9|nr:hypothetical protein [Sphingopyxis sp.]MBJ7502011.1 hypothetical protein [Sphingopyxis sp.]